MAQTLFQKGGEFRPHFDIVIPPLPPLHNLSGTDLLAEQHEAMRRKRHIKVGKSSKSWVLGCVILEARTLDMGSRNLEPTFFYHPLYNFNLVGSDMSISYQTFQVSYLPEYEKPFYTSFYKTNFVVLFKSSSLVSNLAKALR